MLVFAITLVLAAILVCGSAWLVVRKSQRTIEFFDRLEPLGDEPGVSLVDAASILRVSRFDVPLLVWKGRLDARLTGDADFAITTASMENERDRREQRGRMRRAVDRVWRVVRWLP